MANNANLADANVVRESHKLLLCNPSSIPSFPIEDRGFWIAADTQIWGQCTVASCLVAFHQRWLKTISQDKRSTLIERFRDFLQNNWLKVILSLTTSVALSIIDHQFLDNFKWPRFCLSQIVANAILWKKINYFLVLTTVPIYNFMNFITGRAMRSGIVSKHPCSSVKIPRRPTWWIAWCYPWGTPPLAEVYRPATPQPRQPPHYLKAAGRLQ